MLIIGLTGGIGSGKSTVARYFEQLSIPVIDADQAARLVVQPQHPALQKIAAHFGNDIINNSSELNRGLLREKIFADAKERQWLENLLHPLIAEEIQQQLQQAKGAYVILMSPLLLESGQSKLVNRVLLVDVPESIQIQRTQQRDQVSEAQIQAIMQSQWTREQRLAKADDVIENLGSLEILEKQVEQLHQKYLTLALL